MIQSQKLLLLAGLFFEVGCARANELSPTPADTYTRAGPTSPSALPTYTPTFIPLSTLPYDAAYVQVGELLQDNNDCELPCLWGITPGVSSPLVAWNRLWPFTSLRSVGSTGGGFIDEGGGISIEYPADDVRILIDVTFISDHEHDLVDLVELDAWPIQESRFAYGPSAYSRVLDRFTLHGILSTYGKPEEISMFVELNQAEADAPDFWYIMLLYPKRGIFVRYTALADYGSGATTVSACPENSNIELSLMPLAENNNAESRLPSTYPWADYSEAYGFAYLSTDQAVDMTLDDFYQTYRQMSYRCLETSLARWPVYKDYYESLQP